MEFDNISHFKNQNLLENPVAVSESNLDSETTTGMTMKFTTGIGLDWINQLNQFSLCQTISVFRQNHSTTENFKSADSETPKPKMSYQSVDVNIKKDEKYHEKRRRINIATKKCDTERRLSQNKMEERVRQLETEHIILQTQVAMLQEESNFFKFYLMQKGPLVQQPSIIPPTPPLPAV